MTPPYDDSQPRRWRILGLEAALAFFGIYGTGWLLAGEKRVGALLLGGSLLLQLSALLTVADMQGWIVAYLVASLPFHVVFLSVSLVLLARKTTPPPPCPSRARDFGRARPVAEERTR